MLNCIVCGELIDYFSSTFAIHSNKDQNHKIEIYGNSGEGKISEIVLTNYKKNNTEQFIYIFYEGKLVNTEIILSYDIDDKAIIFSLEDFNKYKENLIFK